MLFSLAAALILGLAAGGLLVFLLLASRRSVELQPLQARAEALASELAAKNTALDIVRERETAGLARVASLEATSTQIAAQMADLRSALEKSRTEAEQWRTQAGTLETENARLRTALDKERVNAEEKLAMLTAARQELSNQFKALANEILEQKSKAFTEQNQTNLTNLLHPLKEKFGEFQTKVESLQKDGIAGRSELKTQIDQLRTLNERLSQDATNLVSALKGSSKIQGDWGEFVLESLLESSGLRKGHEYRVQENFQREDRSRVKPDVILNLPEGRHIIIDAKVSLVDYNNYCSSDDEAFRSDALSRHLASVRGHIKELSQRNYQSIYGLRSLDFVVMFIPIEPAFMLALAQDSRLWEEAWNRNILLVSRTTLLFVLRTVSHLWRQEQQTRNVQEIVRRGGELYDKLAAFAKDLTDVGRSLEAARQSYDEAYKKLAQGKGNAIRQAEMLKGLGIKPTKSFPLVVVEQAIEEPSPELFELAAAAQDNVMSMTETEKP
ncbi:DNA recombination protein RmuC [Paracidobacterium acidisoli]|uniref:DNA recombination protein RmuC n=1 Tax=Paracidobacterium acidisoli TaxID=2303751 RepID=A0A372IP04_9BACT|nr:DNA recombination protein RmuC [Paracidobacterium acidisoli]MBT9330912.1 DNA recombination protein RmuC [Paracidobacterium acidisoli]